jgi:hypothetical protein
LVLTRPPVPTEYTALIHAALGQLSPAQRATLDDVGDTGTFLGRSGVINTVLQAALSRRGDEYVPVRLGPTSSTARC